MLLSIQSPKQNITNNNNNINKNLKLNKVDFYILIWVNNRIVGERSKMP